MTPQLPVFNTSEKLTIRAVRLYWRFTKVHLQLETGDGAVAMKCHGPILASLLLVCLFSLVSSSQPRYNGHKVYRVVPRSVAHMEALRNFIEANPEIEMWREPIYNTYPVDIHVPAYHLKDFQQHVRFYGIPYYALIDDIQRQIVRLQTNRRSRPTNNDIFTDYLTFDEIMRWLEYKANACGQRCSLLTIGQSTEGRDIRVIKIGTDGSNKQKLWIDAGIHAREWISPATALYFIERLISDYESNDVIRRLVDAYDWYILPVINPDGYNYTWTTDRLWRKTRSKNSTTPCVGVDPNRNFDHKWMTVGASDDPCENTYAGPTPFSEPETKAMADFLRSHQGSWRLYLTLHSYKQLWMAPWGYTKEFPDTYDKLMRAGEVAVTALTATHGTVYTLGSASSILYQSSGTSRDWAYGTMDIEYVYTVELRDTGRHGFLLPPENIRPCGEETWNALQSLVLFITNRGSGSEQILSG